MSKKRVRRRHKCPDCWRVNVICAACQADIDAVVAGTWAPTRPPPAWEEIK